MRRVMGLVLLMISPAAAQQTQPKTGLIEGTLSGEDGIPITGGAVTLRLVDRTFKSKLQSTDWVTITDLAGGFRFEGLPDGRYTFCAQVPHSVWLNPCEWGVPSPSVTLSNVNAIARIAFVLPKGFPLHVRVDDPGQLVARHEGKTAGARLFLAIASTGYVMRWIPLIAVDATGRDYELVAPFDVSLKLVVRSSFFRINDADGISLSRTTSTVFPVVVPAGQKLGPVKFTVTGIV